MKSLILGLTSHSWTFLVHRLGGEIRTADGGGRVKKRTVTLRVPISVPLEMSSRRRG